MARYSVKQRLRWRAWRLSRYLLPWVPWVVPFEHGLRIAVCPRDNLAEEYVFHDGFEQDVGSFLASILKAGMCVFDVGANIGHHTLIAAMAVTPSGSVHAFEASPSEFRKLNGNVRLNRISNVFAVNVAVSSSTGTATLRVCSDGFGVYNSLGRPLVNDYSELEVSTVSIDDYVAAQNVNRVHLIKIDVEGAELEVLKGATGILSNSQPPILVCEFSDKTASSLGTTSSELRRFIESFGYQLYSYDPVNCGLLKEPVRTYYEYSNLICLAPFHTEGAAFSLTFLD